MAFHLLLYFGRASWDFYYLRWCHLRAPRERKPLSSPRPPPPTFGSPLQVLSAGLILAPLAASAPSFPREAGGDQNGCWRLRHPSEGNCSTSWPGEQRWRPGPWLVPQRPPPLHPIKELPGRKSTDFPSCWISASFCAGVLVSAYLGHLGLVGHGLGPLLPCRYYCELVRINVGLRESRARRLTELP